MIAEAEEVDFQALALHHLDVRDIADANLREIGLARDGAQAGKLRAVKPYPVVVLRVLVVESLQHLGGVVLLVVGLPAQQMQLFF